MSPEQAAGDRQVDHRSDLWSLAIIAVECLSGKRAFQSTGIGQLFASIINGPTPPLADLYPEASPALVAWWVRATAKDPRQRYESAVELAREFVTGLLGASHRGMRTYGNLNQPNANVPPSVGVLARPDPHAAMLTVTTPGESHRTPWNGVAGATHAESVSPFSTTKTASTVELDFSPRRRVITPKRALLAMAALTVAGAFWMLSPFRPDGHAITAASTVTETPAAVPTPSHLTAAAQPDIANTRANAEETAIAASATTLTAPGTSATGLAEIAPAHPDGRVDVAPHSSNRAATSRHPSVRGAGPAVTPDPSPHPSPAAPTSDRVGFW
jgi:serine/threonine-protein kinase